MSKKQVAVAKSQSPWIRRPHQFIVLVHISHHRSLRVFAASILGNTSDSYNGDLAEDPLIGVRSLPFF